MTTLLTNHNCFYRTMTLAARLVRAQRASTKCKVNRASAGPCSTTPEVARTAVNRTELMSERRDLGLAD